METLLLDDSGNKLDKHLSGMTQKQLHLPLRRAWSRPEIPSVQNMKHKWHTGRAVFVEAVD